MQARQVAQGIYDTRCKLLFRKQDTSFDTLFEIIGTTLCLYSLPEGAKEGTIIQEHTFYFLGS